MRLIPLYLFTILIASGALATEDCQEAASKLGEMFPAYASLAAQNNSKAADRMYRRINELVQTASNGGCREPILEAYAINALGLPSSAGLDRYHEDPGLLVPQGPALQLLEALFERGKVVFLTTDESRAALGEHWADKTSKGDYEAVGGYDCATGKVYLDTTLRPLDFSMIVLHELDHLVRDKAPAAETADGIPEFVLNFQKDGQIDWATFNLADEFTATTVSYGLQRYYQSGRKGALTAGEEAIAAFVPFGLFLPLKMKRNYHLRGDFSLYSDRGVLSEMFAPFFKSAKLQENLSVSEQNPPYDAVYDLVAGEAGPYGNTDDVQAELRESNLARRKTWALLSQAYLNEVRASEDLYFPEFIGERSLVDLADLRGVRKVIGSSVYDAIVAGLDAPSQACRLYMQSLAAGKVDHYVGVEFGNGDRQARRSSLRACLRVDHRL